MMRNSHARHTLIIILLLITGAAIITAALPRAGRESLNYEEGQPWKYSLLTAPFDIPVYYDSITENRMADSIRSNFPPYVNISTTAADELVENFPLMLLNHPGVRQLQMYVYDIYSRGIIDKPVKELLNKQEGRKTVNVVSASNTATQTDASAMLTPIQAVDTLVKLCKDESSPFSEIPQQAWDVVNNNLRANVTLDDTINNRQLSNALAMVSSAQGTIRQGQRIIDRGEVVTPQVYRNLQEYEKMLIVEKGTGQDNLGFIAGQAAYLLIVLTIFTLYLAFYRNRVYASTRMMVFIISTIVALSLFAILLTETFTLGIYMTPFTALPIVILLFVDRRTAVVALLAGVMVASLAAVYQFQYLFLQLVAGLTAIFSLKQLSKRSQLLRVSLVTFLTYCICYVVMTLVSEGTLTELSSRFFIYFAVNAALLSLTYVFIFVVERIFGFTSTVTLVELSDINTPLLRRLSEEAPGTFQHSMQVSTLAADAARAIGADTQLVRTGALYHDIGKLSSPVFFTENQHGVNPHNGLAPETSARKIISHVTEGVVMAQKAKLPAVIKDFILEHHGKGVARYFYNTACNAHPDEKIDPAPFTYPGPNPRSRETAIMMMADATEAASRSLKEYSTQSISDLVDKIIDMQTKDGMFSQSPVSFADIETIKGVFKRRLGTIYHSRVTYPERVTN